LRNNMIIKTAKEKRKKRSRERIKVSGRKRVLHVFRSNRFVWAQIIDLVSGKTLVVANSHNMAGKAEKKLTKVEAARRVGEELARRALKNNIKRVVFDKGPYRYHGRIKALAEAARKGGLKF